MSEKNDTANALLDELALCEKRVWNALISGEIPEDAAALHEDFLGVYQDGFANKADHVGQLNDSPTLTCYSLDDLRCVVIAVGCAVLSYRATFSRLGSDRTEIMYVSSIWRKYGNTWLNVFSQDTPAIT